LTARIDFCGLVRKADRSLAASGPAHGNTLRSLRARQLLRGTSPEQAAGIQSSLSRLVSPAQMGALFTAVVLTGGISGPLPPFYIVR
jgi:SAM-dependent MidA family methyltransferase